MTRAAARSALVVGAGGAVGEAVAHALLDVGWRVTATMRRLHAPAAARLAARGVRLLPLALEAPAGLARDLAGVSGVVFAPILTLSVKAAPLVAQAGVERAVFFSSNNVAVDPGDPIYAALAEAEREALAILPQATLPRLMRLMRRTPVFPVPGSGRALQQPVFHKDLARAAAAALLLEEAVGKIYAIGGPDQLSLAALYRAVARAAGGPQVILPTPVWLLNLARRFVSVPLDAAQLKRVEEDKRAVPADPPPPELAARTPLAEGLTQLAADLSAASETQAWRGRRRPA
jgi:NADH dehydrogenase